MLYFSKYLTEWTSAAVWRTSDEMVSEWIREWECVGKHFTFLVSSICHHQIEDFRIQVLVLRSQNALHHAGAHCNVLIFILMNSLNKQTKLIKITIWTCWIKSNKPIKSPVPSSNRDNLPKDKIFFHHLLISWCYKPTWLTENLTKKKDTRQKIPWKSKTFETFWSLILPKITFVFHSRKSGLERHEGE